MTNVVDMGIQQSDMQQKIIRIESQQEKHYLARDDSEKLISERFNSIENKVDKLEEKMDRVLDILIKISK